MTNCSIFISRWLTGGAGKSKEEANTFSGRLITAYNQGGKPGRIFVARMYKAAAKLKKLHHVTRLTKVSSQTYNGGTFLQQPGMVSAL